MKYSPPSVKNLLKPTPAFFVRLGDALMAVSTTITAAAIAEDHKTLAYISLGTGVLGVFLTRLFAVKPNEPEQNL
jgi:hypothetical protein